MSKYRSLFGLPQLPQSVWILAGGRFLSQIGMGFTLFYAPIFFVNQVGLSATEAGLGLGSSAVSGILGRFLGGTLSDLPQWGRRRTLLLSAFLSAIADVILATIYDFPSLLLGSIIMGLGIGLYWPSAEAAVADFTPRDRRNEAFAVSRLADNLGLGLGVPLGGLLIETGLSFRWLFVLDGLSFISFFLLIYFAIREGERAIASSEKPTESSWIDKWKISLRDRTLQQFVLVNLLFTTYLSQTQSTLPLYFTNFLTAGGFSAPLLSKLFTAQIALMVICQLPVARWLSRWSHAKALVLSLCAWAMGFSLIWMTGGVVNGAEIWAILALIAIAFASIAYTPSASAFVSDLAPDELRGTYMAINAQCWAIGYAIGPTLGGWVLDQSVAVADGFWLLSGFSVTVGIAILLSLDRDYRR